VVVRPDDLDDVGDGVLGQQHPAEYALLRGDIVRRRPLELVTSGGDLGDTHPAAPPQSGWRCLAGADLADAVWLASRGWHEVMMLPF
jgi:hypothetical protein